MKLQTKFVFGQKNQTGINLRSGGMILYMWLFKGERKLFKKMKCGRSKEYLAAKCSGFTNFTPTP